MLFGLPTGRRRIPDPRVNEDLGPGPDPILRLQVHEDLGVAQALTNGVLKLVRGPVGILERRPSTELHVHVDQAARARPPRTDA
jgi:hypothetical protein